MKIRQLILFFLLINSLLAQDWPQLSYYQEANKLLKTSAEAVIATPSFFDTNNFVGRGIGGQTSPTFAAFQAGCYRPSAEESDLTCRNQRYCRKHRPNLTRSYYGKH